MVIADCQLPISFNRKIILWFRTIIEKMYNTLIIGAGLSGLIAARELQQAGQTVLLLDKGRGIGGRLATRWLEVSPGDRRYFDFGAQYFTARDPQFVKLVRDWKEQGIVREWSKGFTRENGELKIDGESRFVGVDGMRGIARKLAADLDVKNPVRIVNIKQQDRCWLVRDEADNHYRAQRLVLTQPAPQIAELFQSSDINVDKNLVDRLRNVIYHKCISWLVVPASMTRIPAPGGIWGNGEPIHFIADNHQKGISSGPSVTVHAGPRFSEDYWDCADDAVEADLVSYCAAWIDQDFITSHVHRWRYSQPIDNLANGPVRFSQEPDGWISGEVVNGGRVEGAALSGLHVAQNILGQLDL